MERELQGMEWYGGERWARGTKEKTQETQKRCVKQKRYNCTFVCSLIIKF